MSPMSSPAVTGPGASQRLVGEGLGGDDVPRAAWPVVLRPSWRDEARSKSHVVSTPPVRVVDVGDARGEDVLAMLVLEETRAAGDSSAADRSDEMPEQAGRHPRIVDHRHLTGRDLACAETAYRPLARAPPHLGGIAEIAGVDRARIVVIAFHAGAFAGDDADADTVPGTDIAAGKAVRCDNRQLRALP